LPQRATAIKEHDADDDPAPEFVQRVEDIAMEGLRRAVVALDDLETITALKSSL
jgi:hypothetical protein